MATAGIISNAPIAFVYEDLIAKVRMIQNQMNTIQIVLINRWKTEKRKRDELKSRSLVFVDPYGNRTVDKYMDHELIDHIIKKYKQDYVPKYLQQWIKIGIMNGNTISPLKDCELKSIVTHYADGFEFITYGEVTVWIGTYDNALPRKVVLRVLLMDTFEKIKARLKRFQKVTNIELESFIINSYEEPNEENWNEGRIFKSEDTIMACQLYRNNHVILAKDSEEKVMDTNNEFNLSVKTVTGKCHKLAVNSYMAISTLKELIQDINGLHPDQQTLLLAGRKLEVDRTLSDYNIKKESTIHMVPRLRGGMYHFTSGRHNFHSLPTHSAKAIQDVLSFKIIGIDRTHHSSSAELQEFAIQAHTFLYNLHHETKELHTLDGLPNLRNVILPMTDDSDDDQ